MQFNLIALCTLMMFTLARGNIELVDSGEVLESCNGYFRSDFTDEVTGTFSRANLTENCTMTFLDYGEPATTILLIVPEQPKLEWCIRSRMLSFAIQDLGYDFVILVHYDDSDDRFKSHEFFPLLNYTEMAAEVGAVLLASPNTTVVRITPAVNKIQAMVTIDPAFQAFRWIVVMLHVIGFLYASFMLYFLVTSNFVVNVRLVVFMLCVLVHALRGAQQGFDPTNLKRALPSPAYVFLDLTSVALLYIAYSVVLTAWIRAVRLDGRDRFQKVALYWTYAVIGIFCVCIFINLICTTIPWIETVTFYFYFLEYLGYLSVFFMATHLVILVTRGIRMLFMLHRLRIATHSKSNGVNTLEETQQTIEMKMTVTVMSEAVLLIVFIITYGGQYTASQSIVTYAAIYWCKEIVILSCLACLYYTVAVRHDYFLKRLGHSSSGHSSSMLDTTEGDHSMPNSPRQSRRSSREHLKRSRDTSMTSLKDAAADKQGDRRGSVSSAGSSDHEMDPLSEFRQNVKRLENIDEESRY